MRNLSFMNHEEMIIHLKIIIQDLDRAIDKAKLEYPQDPFRMRSADGRFLLLDAYSAKANALAALAQLEALHG